MAAPAHLVQLIAQRGGGVAIPAGDITWDVPFPRALELARRTGARVLAGLPLEPVVLGELARAQGHNPARVGLDTLFLGGAPVPPAFQRRLARVWGARVIELYGSTETMLLGTSCPAGTLHPETALAYCEVLPLDGADEGRLVVTTIGVEGSPLVRFDTGDVVRVTTACACGDPRPGLVVLGRAPDAVEIAGRRLFPYDLIDAAAAAADALDSSVFFIVVLPGRVLVRIETRASGPGDRTAALRARLPGVRGGAGDARRRGRHARRRRAGGAPPLAPRLDRGAARHRRGAAAGGQPAPRDLLAALLDQRVRRRLPDVRHAAHQRRAGARDGGRRHRRGAARHPPSPRAPGGGAAHRRVPPRPVPPDDDRAHRRGAARRARTRFHARPRQHRGARRARVRDATRRRAAPTRRARRPARHHVHLPGDLQPGGLRALHGDRPGEPAQRLRASAHELRPRLRRGDAGREPGRAARLESRRRLRAARAGGARASPPPPRHGGVREPAAAPQGVGHALRRGRERRPPLPPGRRALAGPAGGEGRHLDARAARDATPAPAGDRGPHPGLARGRALHRDGAAC